MPVQWILSFSLFKLYHQFDSHHYLLSFSFSFLPLRSAAHSGANDIWRGAIGKTVDLSPLQWHSLSLVDCSPWLNGFCFIEANSNRTWVSWGKKGLIFRFSSLVLLKKHHNLQNNSKSVSFCCITNHLKTL